MGRGENRRFRSEMAGPRSVLDTGNGRDDVALDLYLKRWSICCGSLWMLLTKKTDVVLSATV